MKGRHTQERKEHSLFEGTCFPSQEEGLPFWVAPTCVKYLTWISHQYPCRDYPRASRGRPSFPGALWSLPCSLRGENLSIFSLLSSSHVGTLSKALVSACASSILCVCLPSQGPARSFVRWIPVNEWVNERIKISYPLVPSLIEGHPCSVGPLKKCKFAENT